MARVAELVGDAQHRRPHRDVALDPFGEYFEPQGEALARRATASFDFGAQVIEPAGAHRLMPPGTMAGIAYGGGAVVVQIANVEGPVDEEPVAVSSTPTERVHRILQALPEHYKEVLTCRFLLNLSIRDTANRMCLTEANVKVLQFRALKRAADLERVVSGIS